MQKKGPGIGPGASQTSRSSRLNAFGPACVPARRSCSALIFFATGLRSISANKTGLSAHANESCQRWRLRIGRLPSQLLILFFKPMLWSCRRFRRLPKSGGPTLLALSLEVERDSIHDPPPGLRSLLLSASRSKGPRQRHQRLAAGFLSQWKSGRCPTGPRLPLADSSLPAANALGAPLRSVRWHRMPPSARRSASCRSHRAPVAPFRWPGA